MQTMYMEMTLEQVNAKYQNLFEYTDRIFSVKENKAESKTNQFYVKKRTQLI